MGDMRAMEAFLEFCTKPLRPVAAEAVERHVQKGPGGQRAAIPHRPDPATMHEELEGNTIN